MASGIVRVVCEKCGPVQTLLVDLTVRCCIENRDDASYAFRCPECNQISVVPIHPSVRESLFGHPLIEVIWWSLPAELKEPKFHPPLTQDDILDFALELEAL